LTATTGISSINLGCITLHSTLKFFDTLSLRDIYLTGQLARKLHEIGQSYRRLIIEEYSMLHDEQLDLIYRGAREANRYNDVTEPLGILLCGDLAQLPPVKGRFCFNAECWPEFAAHTTRLEKVWRQDGGPFLDALNLLRAGQGNDAAAMLADTGARWHSQLDNEFDGTTILPKNDMVNRYNSLALARVHGRAFTVTSRRWGKQQSEWGENKRTHEWGIPQRANFKIGALVMILANKSDFSVVNGDLGHIVDYDIDTGAITIHLIRTGEDVVLDRIVRGVEQKDQPDGLPSDAVIPRINYEEDDNYNPYLHFNKRARRYVLGQVEFYPLRLAYSTTVHKSQSLTLDRIQVDFRDRFFSQPAMLYVALSRCRTLEGLRLVGTPERFAAQCAIDARVLPWI
jgi:ATP-dependent exoDNAse (exonuclease V) alpha subunit